MAMSGKLIALGFYKLLINHSVIGLKFLKKQLEIMSETISKKLTYLCDLSKLILPNRFNIKEGRRWRLIREKC